ncbi:MAG: hypothetical protein ACJ71I_00795 [Nitrososphaeraceae archaeon]
MQHNSHPTRRSSEKFSSGSVINTKRNRDTETQEIIYRDCANVLTRPCSCDSILYGHFAKPTIGDSAFTPAN